MTVLSPPLVRMKPTAEFRPEKAIPELHSMIGVSRYPMVVRRMKVAVGEALQIIVDGIILRQPGAEMVGEVEKASTRDLEIGTLSMEASILGGRSRETIIVQVVVRRS